MKNLRTSPLLCARLFLSLLLTLSFLSWFLWAEEKPNIIFFLTDDQRNDMLGCAGHDIIKTPTIDKLAAQGVSFRNSFIQTPICSASRVTFFTGLSQRTHGFNFGTPKVPEKYAATSYPMQLRKAGYRTGFAGKYGMAFQNSGGKDLFDYFKPIGRNPYLKKQKDGSMRHETELCGDAVIEFINSNPPGKPFCFSVSFNASHAEDSDRRPGFHFQWPKPTDGMYENVTVPAARLGDEKYLKAMPKFLREDPLSRGRFFWRWDTPEKYQTNMKAYFRMITGIDQTIARVLKVLKEKGLDKNTIIIYTADNGYMMGDRGIAGKWNHYEQSLRVPLIIYDPRLPKEKRGRVLDELVINLDIAPTLVQYAGLEIPSVYQGRSLTPLVEGTSKNQWRKDIFCEHQFNRYPNWHAVRSQRYKYAVYYEDGPYESLYDLQKDPDEFVNQISNPEYARILKRMRKRLETYRQEFPEVEYSELVQKPTKKTKRKKNPNGL